MAIRARTRASSSLFMHSCPDPPHAHPSSTLNASTSSGPITAVTLVGAGGWGKKRSNERAKRTAHLSRKKTPNAQRTGEKESGQYQRLRHILNIPHRCPPISTPASNPRTVSANPHATSATSRQKVAVAQRRCHFSSSARRNKIGRAHV